MKTFMVTINLPSAEKVTAEFVSLIPEQRIQVNKLMQSGALTDYALSSDRGRLWAVMQAESESEIYDLIGSFPLRKFMEPDVQELMFHNKMLANFPVLSLN